MSKKWIVTCTKDNCLTTFDMEIEANDYTDAGIKAIYALPFDPNNAYVVDLVEKSE